MQVHIAFVMITPGTSTIITSADTATTGVTVSGKNSNQIRHNSQFIWYKGHYYSCHCFFFVARHALKYSYVQELIHCWLFLLDIKLPYLGVYNNATSKAPKRVSARQIMTSDYFFSH